MERNVKSKRRKKGIGKNGKDCDKSDSRDGKTDGIRPLLCEKKGKQSISYICVGDIRLFLDRHHRYRRIDLRVRT